MHWEATATPTAGPVGPGWHQDPFDATRLRWWGGISWSARVVRIEADSEMISWHAAMSDQPAPSLEPAPIAAVAVVPTPAAAPAAVPIEVAIEAPAPPSVLPTPSEPVLAEAEPTVAVSEPDPPAVVPEDGLIDLTMPARPSGSRRRKAWAMLGAAVVILIAGAGVSAAMLGDEQRPVVEDTITFHDDAADVALRYPSTWHVDERTPGTGIKFVVGAVGVPTDEQNTVSVVAGESDGQPQGRLEDVVNSTSDKLAAGGLTNFRLVSATEARLAGAPGFRLEFVDTTTKPAKRVVQFTGRTTSGRPLLVGITMRDPRTAPTDAEIDKFVRSISSS